MRRLIAFVAFAWPLAVGAQADSTSHIPVQPGDSIRVIMRSGAMLPGVLARQTPGSIALQRDVDGRPADTVVTFVEVASVEARVSRHTVHSMVSGFGTGLLSGAVAGGLLAYTHTLPCSGDGCGFAILAVPMLGIAGGVIGFVAGGFQTTVTWEEVWRAETARP
jgi:hypothetical protein